MRLSDVLVAEAVRLDLKGTTSEESIVELAHALSEAIAFPQPDVMIRLLLEREELGSPAIGDGIAIPHARIPGLKGLAVGLGLSRAGIDFRAADKKKSHLILLLVGPPEGSSLHLKALARIARLSKDDSLRDRLLKCKTAEEAKKSVADAEAKYLSVSP